MKISDILPAKKEVIPAPNKFINTHEDYCEGYNACVDDCAAAIERANLVRCPSLEELRLFISSEYYPRDERATLLAKALLALLHRTAPQNVNNY